MENFESSVKLFTVTLEESEARNFKNNDQESLHSANDLDKSLDICIYQPGEQVIGNVDLVLSRDTQVEKIVLIIEAAIILQAGQNDASEQESILNIEKSLLSTDQHSAISCVMLCRGKHVFPFKYQLPFDIPSTIFISPLLSINYIIKAVIQEPIMDSMGIDKRKMITSKDFIITHRLPNLSDDIYYLPFELSIQKYKVQHEDHLYRALVTKFDGTVKINRRSFEQGEFIIININMHLTSRNKYIDALSAKLAMIVSHKASIFQVNSETRTSSKVVAHIIDKFSFGRKEQRKWDNVPLQIPRFLPASYSNKSHVYDVQYKLIFEAKFRHIEEPISYIVIPIIIGAQTPLSYTQENEMINGGFQNGYEFGKANPNLVNYSPNFGQYAGVRA